MCGCGVYGVIRFVPMTVVFGVGTQLPRRPVMIPGSQVGLEGRGGGGCYLYTSKFISVKVGSLCHLNAYGKSVRLTGVFC